MATPASESIDRKAPLTAPARRPFGEPRAWTRATLDNSADVLFYDLPAAVLDEMSAAIEHCEQCGYEMRDLTAEDFRMPTLARDIPMLRQRMDEGAGFVIVRGMPVGSLSRSQIEMAYWGMSNYLGQVIRQNRGTRTWMDSVSDKRQGRWDPYRVIDTNEYCHLHTDNGFNHPRTPEYMGLLCLRPAMTGGQSLIMSAYTLYNEIMAKDPQWLARLHGEFYMDLPVNMILADQPDVQMMPIFEFKDEDLVMHYLRMYVDPGMEKAGLPLTEEERRILDYIDDAMQRDELRFEYQLQAGEAIYANNAWTLHGRRAFVDDPDAELFREFIRIWMWRRHRGVGLDPVALDARELRDS